MKRWVSTSVYGLVPLPLLRESKPGESRAQPTPIVEVRLEHDEDLTCCHCKAQRKLIRPQWFFTMWRNREADQ